MKMRKGRSKTTDEQRDYICLEYSKGRSCESIGKDIGLTQIRVITTLKSKGVERRRAEVTMRKYAVDFSYFEHIDSHEKAQVLGMLAADGNTSKDDRQAVIRINLHREDRDYLEFMKASLKYTGPVRDFEITEKGKTRYKSSLSINSVKMRRDIIDLGMVPCKSMILKFPTEYQVPDKYMSSFMLGYFDGDGSIGIKIEYNIPTYNVKICVTKEFGESLKVLLRKELDIHCGMSIRSAQAKRGINMWSLQISGNLQVLRFLRWMYKDATFIMKRKHDRYLQLASHYDNDGKLIREEGWLERSKQRRLATVKRKDISMKRPAQYRTLFFMSPINVIYHVRGIRQFAREINVPFTILFAMHRVRKNRFSSRKWGWSPPSEAQIAAAKASNTIVEKFY